MKALTVFVVLWLSAFTVNAQAVDTSRQVCGVQLSQVEVFVWEDFSEGPGAVALASQDLAALRGSLRAVLVARAGTWPQTDREEKEKLLANVDDLSIGELDLADFGITKTMDLPARQVAFYQTPKEIEFPAAADAPACADADAAQALREMANYVLLVRDAHNYVISPAFALVPRATDVLEQQYDKYLFEGYPMYPWEAAVNSWFLTNDSIADGPPRWQLAVLHLSAGVVGHVAEDTDGDIGAALLLEPIGFVRYYDNYDHWYGASLLASFPFDREPGLGFALTWDQFKLGVTWHDDSSGQYDGAAVVLGVELYRFVDRNKRKYTQYQGKLRELLEEGVK